MKLERKVATFLVYISSVMFPIFCILFIVARAISDDALSGDPLARYSALAGLVSLGVFLIALEEADKSNKYIKSMIKLRRKSKKPLLVAMVVGIIVFIVFAIMFSMFEF